METIKWLVSHYSVSLVEALLMIGICAIASVVSILSGCVVHLYKKEKECIRRFEQLQKWLYEKGCLRKDCDRSTGGRMPSTALRDKED